MRKNRSTQSQVVLGVFMALAMVMAIEGFSEVAFHDGWQVDLSLGEDRRSFTLKGPDERLTLKSHGRVELDDDGIADIAPGARVRIHEKALGEERRLEVDGRAGGEPTYRYRVDDRERPFDADARAWLRDVLLTYFRRSGADAEARAQRIVEAGGLPALFEEIGHLEKDFVTARYLEVLLGVEGIAEADVARALEIATSTIDSNHHLADLLLGVDPAQLSNQQVARAFFATASEISSDHHLASVLTSVLASDSGARLSTDLIDSALQTSRAIHSGHHLAELLIALAGNPSADPLPKSLGPAVASIDSDHHQARAIEAFFGHPSLTDERLDELLRVAAEHVDSDHHAREVLVSLAAEHPTGQFPDGAFVLLAAIGSDHHQRVAAESLLQPLDPGARLRVLSTVDLESDHEMAELLIAASHHAYPGIETRPVVEAQLVKMASDHHRDRALEPWSEVWEVPGT